MSEYDCLKLDNQLCFPLYACTRQVINLYTPYLKPLGITYTQYLVLLVLWENKTIPMGELCQKLYLDSGTLTPLLKKLEKKGFITRSKSKEDERNLVLKLTEKGKSLESELKNIPEEVYKILNLSDSERTNLQKELYKILTRIMEVNKHVINKGK